MFRRNCVELSILSLFALAIACDRGGADGIHLPGIDPDGGTFERDIGAPAIAPIDSVRVSQQAPEAVRLAASDVHRYLETMGVETLYEENTLPARCIDGTLTVALLGDGLGAPTLEGEQAYSVKETRCGEGRLVELAGGGLLGRQYAAYAFLHELGVRFFHPEQEFVPAAPQWPEQPLDISRTPDFAFRSVTLHLTHPLELGDPLRLGIEAYKEEVRRYIDWQIKNFASFGLTGSSHFDDLADYGHRRGLPRSVGFDLHNQQQDYAGVVDPDSPLSDEEQIIAAIDEQMGDDPANYPEQFHFTFNPSEFTELPDEDIVRQLTLIADYMAEKYPDTIVMTTNHGTAGPPTENYGVRYYDLPKFAPENLGVKVHTLMFYDLERPAPVYGNENFHGQRQFIEEESEKRRIWHYPEAAWWLTFDIPVPVYLPITIEARDRDLQLIAPLLAKKLDGHRVFGSGHEWGYWQNEYCSLRMSADLEYRWTDCIRDIAHVAGPELGPEVAAALERIVELQQGHWFDPEVIRWLVGSDDETELAAQIGIVFHPLPPRPEEILRWSAEEVDVWNTVTRPRLEQIVTDYEPIVAALRQVEDEVDDDAGPWVREIADGAEVNMLRARHAVEAHSALVLERMRQLGVGDVDEGAPLATLETAEVTTVEVLTITRRRSEDYRYRPRTRAIAPTREDGAADENWTGYGYRYLNRAHHAFYYKRTDRQIREALEGGASQFDVRTVVVGPEDLLTITVLDDALADLATDLGDGTTSTERLVSHAYTAPGVYGVSMTADLDGAAWTADFEVAQLATRYWTGRTGTLVEPQTDLAAQIEALLPGLVVGPLGDGRFVIGTAPQDEPFVPIGAFTVVDEVATVEGFETAPQDIFVPLSVGGSATLSLRILDATLLRTDRDAPVSLLGDMQTESIVFAVAELSGGAFDDDSARSLVADALGYTSETLPEEVPFVVTYEIVEVSP